MATKKSTQATKPTKKPTLPVVPAAHNQVSKNEVEPFTAAEAMALHLTEGESPRWSIATKSIVAVVALSLIVVVIWRFQALLTPLVLAAILAYLLNPPISWLAKRMKDRRGLATLLVYLLLLIVFAGASTALGFVAVDQVSKLADFLPDSINEAVDIAQAQIESISALDITFGPFTLELDRLINWDVLRSLAQQATSLIRPVFSTSGSFITSFFGATVNTVTNLALIFIVSLYLAKDSRAFGISLVEMAAQSGYRNDAERLMRNFSRIWNAYLRGQVILGLVIFFVVWIVLTILNVNNALGLAILAGILEFLPIVGPLVGAGAAILVAFFQDGNWLGIESSLTYAIVVAVAMILIQQVENNLLVPRIVGGALDLHELLVMVSVIMGATLAGILGAVLAAPVVASIKLFGNYAWRKLLDLPPFPETEPPPKPKRGESGWEGRWRLWRLRVNRIIK